MTAIRTARERARAELIREIKDEARRQLAESGAAGLSLRAVARELGMASSAIYRYFPSRDDLLTALIIEAYDALADEVDAASRSAPPAHFRARLAAMCRAVRAWARAHPNEYALVYGSPVPGYHAPLDTVAPGSRVPLALLGLLGEAWAAGALGDAAERRTDAAESTTAAGARADLPPDLPPVLVEQALAVAQAGAPGLPPLHVTHGALVWVQLFGLVSFEVFGQLNNSLDPADAFFDYTVEQIPAFLGLAADPAGARDPA